MAFHSTIAVSIILASVSLAAAQVAGAYPAAALASKGPYIYPGGIPYKVDTDVGLVRGTQVGYNICNSTTESQTSLCQTSWLNGLDDFCLWAPAEYGREVGDIEGSMIAWCTKPGHGTRLIPEGALTGVQFMKTSDYIQVVGFLDQTKINILKGDYGGEMDPHGADLRGNPMGGLIFSDEFTGSPVQAVEWHNFIGSDSFCLKACDPAGPNAKHFCEHIYDRIGCSFNAPNSARDLVFESCEGENQDFPGTYVENGVTITYKQPAESLGPITAVPYVARVPASSNCKSFSSVAIYTGLPSSAATTTSASSTSSGASAGPTSNTATNTSNKSTTSPSVTGTASPSATDNTSAATTMKLSGLAQVVCAVLSFFFLA